MVVPLARGFDRFYGFMDAETDQYAPEVVRDNSHVRPPGTFETGYHLTEDLFDNAITYLAGPPCRLAVSAVVVVGGPGGVPRPSSGSSNVDRPLRRGVRRRLGRHP